MGIRLLIFSGYNPRAILAFLRTLVKYEIYDFSIIARDTDDEILNTAYRQYVDYIRKNKVLDRDDLLTIYDIMKKKYAFSDLIIIPSTEYLNRYLLDNREWIESLGMKIPLVEKRIYELISNKKSFSDFCQNSGLQVPKQIEFPDKFIDKFVAKPKVYENINGDIYSPVIIQSQQDYNLFCKNYNLDDFYYQDYVNGRSIYLLCYFSCNGKAWLFSQENLMQQPEGKSILWAKTSEFHKQSITDKYVKLIKGMDFHGLIMIELRVENNNYYMIEANPRLWGPSQLFVDADYNLFVPFLHDLGCIEANTDDMCGNHAEYFWYEGYNLSKGKEVYYSSSKDLLKEKISELMEIDVYNREDTTNLWKKMS